MSLAGCQCGDLLRRSFTVSMVTLSGSEKTIMLLVKPTSGLGFVGLFLIQLWDCVRFERLVAILPPCCVGLSTSWRRLPQFLVEFCGIVSGETDVFQG